MSAKTYHYGKGRLTLQRDVEGDSTIVTAVIEGFEGTNTLEDLQALKKLVENGLFAAGRDFEVSCECFASSTDEQQTDSQTSCSRCNVARSRHA